MWARGYRRHAIALLAAAGSLALAASPAAAGDGGFAGDLDIPMPLAKSLAVGDFNNDGRPDLAVVGGGLAKVAILLQTPEGELSPAPPVEAGEGLDLVEVADFNGDGNEDLAVTNPLDAQVSIRLGVGNGTFTKAPDVDLGSNYAPISLAVGDFNNDVRDDLAVATVPPAPPNSIRIRMGVGDGTFTAATPVAVSGVAAIAVGDFNSDANEDLVYDAFGQEADGVLLGNGSGGFSVAGKEARLPGSSSRSLAVADFDANGRADVLGAASYEHVSVRLGAGDGGLASGPDLPLGGSTEPQAVAVGDFNSDAHEDFVVADERADSVHVRLGDGVGGFSSAPGFAVGKQPVDVVVADLNGDGNEDVATANLMGNSVSVRHGTGPAPLAGSLLVNGGFEGPVRSGKGTPTPLVPGWELTGGTDYLRYGAPSHSFSPSWRSSPRYGTGGGRMLWGGYSAPTGGITTAFQTVDVSASAQAIDAGRATANLSAWLGGTRAYADAMSARAELLDAGGATLATIELGPVTPADRNNLTTLLHRAAGRAVPPGTRSIRVTLISNDADKAYSSALADNVKLTLESSPAVEPRPEPDPEPVSPTAAFGPRTLVTLALARQRIRAGRPVRVRVRNGNQFAVTGRLRATAAVSTAGGHRRVALRARSLRIAARKVTTVALALPARARRELTRRGSLTLRLIARVRDQAGNSRRVTRRTQVRLVTPPAAAASL
jgi:FG-GAP-like repeat